MTKKIFSALMITSAVLSLAACEATKKQLDLSKKAPDEFAVMTRAPLEMPPDYDLPAPKPGAPRPQEASTSDLAKTAVLGEDAAKQVATQNGVSEGEAVLLQKTGGANASPAIRAEVDQETATLADKNAPGIDKLKSMVGMTVEPKAKVVDPVAEAERLKQNKTAAEAAASGNASADQ